MHVPASHAPKAVKGEEEGGNACASHATSQQPAPSKPAAKKPSGKVGGWAPFAPPLFCLDIKVVLSREKGCSV